MPEQGDLGEHPSRTQLTAFLGGELAQPEVVEIVRHLVVGCSACHENLAALGQEIPDYDFSITRAFVAVRRLAQPGETKPPDLDLAVDVWPTSSIACSEEQCRILLRAARELRHEPRSMALAAAAAVAVAEGMLAEGPDATATLRLQVEAWAELGNAKRIANDLTGATRAFSLAYARLEESGRRGARDPWLCARVMDLDASLRRARRRFAEATQLLDWAVEVYLAEGDPRAAGHALVKQGWVIGWSGDLERGVQVTLEGLGFLEYEEDPVVYFKGLHNIVLFYTEAGFYREARSLFESGRDLYRAHASLLDRMSIRLVEGRIAAGLGEFLPALRAFTEARDGFAERGLPYDCALASLDLCLLWLEHGHYGNIQAVLGEVLLVFYALAIEPDAAQAVVVLYEAATQRKITEALVRSTVERLREIQQGAAAAR